MPGATRIRGMVDGGTLKGGAPRVVWQTLGADPRVVSDTSAAQRLGELGRACHLVWNPFQGGITQLIPIVRAGRLLGRPEGLNATPPSWPDAEVTAGEVDDANAEGRLCVQVCVVALAWQPFTFWPLPGLQQILDWLDSWGIPRRWPAGPPAPFPDGLVTPGSHRLWSRGGYFGASQVPDVLAAGPGAIDIERLTGRAAECAGRMPEPQAKIRDLDEYFDDDEAPAAGALSTVG
ncbi:MAG TPA: hypothetical protein VMF87_09335 [Streptosporangiaceae bacterium]|nr:hypothetical protein [Streptosporangiaceae bacterium]